MPKHVQSPFAVVTLSLLGLLITSGSVWCQTETLVSGSKVGIGTSTPAATLHVTASDGTTSLLVEETSSNRAPRTLLRLRSAGQLLFLLERTDGTAGTWSFTHNGSQLNLSKVGTGFNELAIFDNGDLEARGTITGNVASPSSRALKTGFTPVDARAVLGQVLNLPIFQWRYKTDPSLLHMGPVAEDFAQAFGVGGLDKIYLVDVNGVALAAIQGLSQRVDQKQAALEALQAQNAELTRRLDQVEAAMEALAQRP